VELSEEAKTTLHELSEWKSKQLAGSKMTEHFFETTAGVKVKIQPISMFDLQLAQQAVQNEFRARGEQVDPPTYEVDVLGGEKEYHQYTEMTIQDASPEEKATWERHILAITQMGQEIQDRTALVLLEGICVELPADNAWAERRKRLFGEEVPEDEEQRKLYYINNILLKTPADKSGLMMAIQRVSLTGANEEAIQAMEDLFQRQMEASGRAGTEVLKALAKEKAGMVLQPDTPGRTGGQSMGDDAKPIQKASRRRPGHNNSR